MKISFNPRSATESEVESFLQDLAEKAEARDEPIRVRVQPQLYHPKGEKGKKGSGIYRSWRLLAWTLEMENLDEVLAFRGSLTYFIDFLERYGPIGTESWFKDTLENMSEKTSETQEKEPTDA